MKILSHRDALTKAMEKTAIPFPPSRGVHNEWNYDVTKAALVYMGIKPTKATAIASRFGGIARKRLDACVSYMKRQNLWPVQESTQ